MYKRHYGSEYTKLHLTGKALEAYNNMDIDIYEIMDRAYTVKPEYQHLWGDDVTDDTIIWDPEIEYLAQEWEKDETELWEQLDDLPVYHVPGYFENLKTEAELIRWLEDGLL